MGMGIVFILWEFPQVFPWEFPQIFPWEFHGFVIYFICKDRTLSDRNIQNNNNLESVTNFSLANCVIACNTYEKMHNIPLEHFEYKLHRIIHTPESKFKFRGPLPYVSTMFYNIVVA